MSQKTTHQSNTKKNKQLVRNFLEDTLLNKHDNIEGANKYLGQGPGRNNQQVIMTKEEDFKEARQRFFQEFPDSHTAIGEHIVAEGDKVFVMLTTTATSKQTGNRGI